MISRATTRQLSSIRSTITQTTYKTKRNYNICPNYNQRHTIRMSSTSTSTPTKEWLVQVPDHPNALSKRLEARPIHLSNLKPSIESGKVVFGGATLTEHPTAEGQTPNMTGSVLLIKAESEQEVREWLEKDPYTKGGAWDVENAKIWPFKTAVRTAL